MAMPFHHTSVNMTSAPAPAVGATSPRCYRTCRIHPEQHGERTAVWASGLRNPPAEVNQRLNAAIKSVDCGVVFLAISEPNNHGANDLRPRLPETNGGVALLD